MPPHRKKSGGGGRRRDRNASCPSAVPSPSPSPPDSPSASSGRTSDGPNPEDDDLSEFHPPPPPRSVSSPSLRRLAALCAAVSLTLYANTHGNDFSLDDFSAIRDNPDVRGTSPLRDLLRNDFWGRPLADPSSHKSYRPLTVLMSRINGMACGMRPRGFHVWNNILNAACSAAAVWAASAVRGGGGAGAGTGTGGVEVGGGGGRRYRGSAGSAGPAAAASSSSALPPYLIAASLLFAFHPVHTEAAASVVGRADLLSALLAFGSFACHGRSMTAGGGGGVGSTAVCYASALALAWASALTKETGASVLAVCGAREVAAVWIPALSALGRGRGGGGGPAKRAPPRTAAAARSIARFAGLALTGLSYVLFRAHINGEGGFGVRSASFQDNPLLWVSTPTSYALTALHVQALYGWRLVYPLTLLCEYGYDVVPLIEGWSDPRNLLTLVWAAVVLVLVRTGLREAARPDDGRDPRLLVALAWVAAPLLPASHVIPIGTVLAERLLFVPSLGYCIIVGLMLERWSGLGGGHVGGGPTARGGRRRRAPPPAGGMNLAPLSAFGAVLLVFAVRVVDRNREWRDNRTLFEATYATHPRNVKIATGHLKQIMSDGDVDGALRIARDNVELLRALSPERRSNLSDFTSYLILSKAMVTSDAGGRNFAGAHAVLDEAESAARGRNNSQRYDFEVYSARADLLFQENRTEEALAWFRTAADVAAASSPGNPKPHCYLGEVLAATGSPSEGVGHLERCVELSERGGMGEGEYVASLENLGIAYYQTGMMDESEGALLRARGVRENPKLVGILDSIARRRRAREAAAGGAR